MCLLTNPEQYMNPMGCARMDPVTATIVIASAAAGAADTTSKVLATREAEKDLRRRARQVRKAGKQEAEAVSQRGEALAASQRAAFGAAGLEASGTPGLVSLDTLLNTMLESNRVIQGAKKQSDQLRRQARNTAIGGYLSAAGTVSGTVGEIASAFIGAPAGTIQDADPASKTSDKGRMLF